MEGICRDCNTVLPPGTLWSNEPIEDEITSKLRNASKNGHKGCIRALLDSGADVNADCFIVESAGGGHLECLQLLLVAGADINRRHNDRGVTALHAAAQKGQEATLEELLRLGADVNARDRYCQKTPLMMAAQSGRSSCARILIRAGADVDAQDYKEYNALIRAAYFDQSETVKTLIEAGADVNLGDLDGRNKALFIAVKKGAVESLKLLLKAGADVNGYATGSGVNKMEYDVNYANENEENAVNTGADMNKSGGSSRGDGESDANEDEGRGVNTGADVNKTGGSSSGDGESDAYEDEERCVNTGAGVNKNGGSSSDDGESNANEDKGRCVNTGAGVNKSGGSSSDDGESNANKDVERAVNNVKKMGLYDVDMEADDVNSTSADEEGGVTDVNTEEKIADSDNEEDVSDLSESDSDQSSEDIPYPLLIKAIMIGQCECAIVLIEAGADVNIYYICAPLIAASELGYVAVVKALIQNGANVNEVDNEGATAIFLAVTEEHYECAELLTAAGAEVNGMYWGVYTLLHLLSVHSYTANMKFLKLLLRAGARVNEPITVQKYMTEPMSHPHKREMAWLFFAAGETLDGTAGEMWIPFCRETLKEMNLKNFCRNEIRRCLIARDRHTHLFGRIPLLKLPKQIERFLLYELSLEDDE